jgi:hypothetical protein
MKFLLSLSLLLMLAVPKSYGQKAELDINTNWMQLTKQLKLRSLKVVDLTNDLLKLQLRNERKDVITTTNLLAKEITAYLDSAKQLDSNTVRIVFDKNKKLTDDYLQIFAYNEYEMAGSPILNLLNSFIVEFYTIEKEILTAKGNYNTACVANKKLDLIFDCLKPDKDVKVQF